LCFSGAHGVFVVIVFKVINLQIHNNFDVAADVLQDLKAIYALHQFALFLGKVLVIYFIKLVG
jgi:hypothetical protein